MALSDRPAERVPQRDGITHSTGGEVAAVRAEREAAVGAVVGFQVRAFHVRLQADDPDRAVVAGGSEQPAVRTETNAVHGLRQGEPAKPADFRQVPHDHQAIPFRTGELLAMRMHRQPNR